MSTQSLWDAVEKASEGSREARATVIWEARVWHVRLCALRQADTSKEPAYIGTLAAPRVADEPLHGFMLGVAKVNGKLSIVRVGLDSDGARWIVNGRLRREGNQSVRGFVAEILPEPGQP